MYLYEERGTIILEIMQAATILKGMSYSSSTVILLHAPAALPNMQTLYALYSGTFDP